MPPSLAAHARPRFGVPLALAVVAWLAASACVGGSTSAPPGPPSGSPLASPVGPTTGPGTGGPVGASASASEVPSQTDTDWGRIWDAVPRSFPLPPGAAVAETGEGPASARFAVPADPVAVAAAIEPQLAGAGYVVTRTGPYEDGSFVLELKGVAGCRAQFTVAPFGANSEMTLLTVLFGAACPYG